MDNGQLCWHRKIPTPMDTIKNHLFIQSGILIIFRHPIKDYIL